MKEKIRYFLCGLAMGAADTVPGVSGGTIAFITGIYHKLLEAIKSVNIIFFKLFFKGNIKEALLMIPWGFCIPLFLGIVTAIVSLAKIVVYLMNTHPNLIWAFFFGLILASLFILLKELKGKDKLFISTLCGIIGFIFAVWLTYSNPINLSHSNIAIFFSAFVAICAMILPGISGAFVLVLLGQYQYILQAVSDLNFTVIAIFLSGCICGLLSFAHIVSACLKRFYKATLSFLAGILAGSLIDLYPFAPEKLTSNSENIFILLALILLGIAIPLLLHKFREK